MINQLQDGPIESISFVVRGAKEQEKDRNGNYSQMVFVEYADGSEGFANLYNQPEVTGADEGATHAYMSVVKEYQGKRGLNGVQVKTSRAGKPYIQVGKAALRFVGDEVSSMPSQCPDQAAGPSRSPRRQTTSSGAAAKPSSKREGALEDRIEYGVEAVKIALEKMPNIPGDVLQAVYNSSMYAYQDGVPLRKEAEDRLVSSARSTFQTGPTSEPPVDEEDDIPF